MNGILNRGAARSRAGEGSNFFSRQISGCGALRVGIPVVPLVIFWHFCRFKHAQAPVRRVSGDENGVFLVFFDSERSERQNFGFLSSECRKRDILEPLSPLATPLCLLSILSRVTL